MIVVWLMAVVGSAGPATSADERQSEERLEVRKLRGGAPVALFKCDDLSTPAQQVAPEQFQGPWAAKTDKARPMYLRVTVTGEEYCVKKHLVETDATVPATRDGKECKKSGVKPRPASDRNVGGCPQ